MKLDPIQQAAQAQFGRQSRNYGCSHILAAADADRSPRVARKRAGWFH